MNKSSLFFSLFLLSCLTFFVWKSADRKRSEPIVDTVIIGTNAEFQPFSFKEGEKITGFDIEVLEHVLNRLGKKFIIKDLPFDALIPEVQLGNVHVIAGGITPTKERALRVLFTQPHLEGDGLYIISLKNNDSSMNSIDDLKGKTVVVNEGYTADSYMSLYNDINVLRLSSNSVSDGILALKSKRADAFVTAFRPMQPYFKTANADDFMIIALPDTQESSAFAISKHTPELRDLIQIMLDRMVADGSLEILKQKWGVS